MLDSLINRAKGDGKALTRTLVNELEIRAEDSIEEMMFAHNYRNIVPNHCHESDSRWKFPILIGEPRKVVTSLNDIIKTGYSSYVDKGKEYAFFVDA